MAPAGIVASTRLPATVSPSTLRSPSFTGGDTFIGRPAGRGGPIAAGDGVADVFLYPGGTPIAHVDALLTNFHLPRSSLLMLVCAFAGREAVLRAYHEAVAAGYRFYSYGDAMLIA